jgi:uncharacterized protein
MKRYLTKFLPWISSMVQQPQPDYSVIWVNQMADIPQMEWDTLAQPLQTPFLEWEWLNNLETSGSATAKPVGCPLT